MAFTQQQLIERLKKHFPDSKKIGFISQMP
jgi:hypothetical protein